jgi:hypothetical protein
MSVDREGNPGEDRDPLDEIIREVAIRHGYVIDRHDPILMTYTINRKVMEASVQIQSALLAECRREWEGAASRIQDEAAARLEQRMQEAITASRLQLQEAVVKLEREQRRLGEEATRQVMAGLRGWQRLAQAHLALSCVLLGAAALVLCVAGAT